MLSEYIDSHVSTHGSLAGADALLANTSGGEYVSTHGSLAGADDYRYQQIRCDPPFQLTAPLREPTHLIAEYAAYSGVSTHGSLAGADCFFHFHNFTHTVSTHGSLAGADTFIVIHN